MNEELLAAIESATPEMIVAAFVVALEAAYLNHPRDGYVAALASIAAAHAAIAAKAKAAAEAAAKAEAEAQAKADAEAALAKQTAK